MAALFTGNIVWLWVTVVPWDKHYVLCKECIFSLIDVSIFNCTEVLQKFKFSHNGSILGCRDTVSFNFHTVNIHWTVLWWWSVSRYIPSWLDCLYWLWKLRILPRNLGKIQSNTTCFMSLLLRCFYIIISVTCFSPFLGHLQVVHFPLWGKPYSQQCYDIVVDEISCNIFKFMYLKLITVIVDLKCYHNIKDIKEQDITM